MASYIQNSFDDDDDDDVLCLSPPHGTDYLLSDLSSTHSIASTSASSSVQKSFDNDDDGVFSLSPPQGTDYLLFDLSSTHSIASTSASSSVQKSFNDDDDVVLSLSPPCSRDYLLSDRSSTHSMASTSTSSSSVQKRFKYDVFLSFRGEDTRKNFVDHLYHALHQKGFTIYKDDERIEKGERLSEQLNQSIQDSTFHIIVFSKTYASSSWCLEELVKIMECQRTTEHTAYPVFYDVEPSEVRNQSGSVGEAFAKLVAKHEKGIRMFSFFKWFRRIKKRTLEDVDLVTSLSFHLYLFTNMIYVFEWTQPLDLLILKSFALCEIGKGSGCWQMGNALKEAAALARMELKNTSNGHEAKFIQQIVQDISLKILHRRPTLPSASPSFVVFRLPPIYIRMVPASLRLLRSAL